jgi:hypothetical protein
MFKTTPDAASRELLRAVIRVELNLVGVAMRAECKMIDKIVDGVTARVLDHPFAVLAGVIFSIFGVGVTTSFS